MEDKTKVNVLGFREDLIPEILSGEKNNTWRIWTDKYIVVGDEVDLLNQKDGKIFGRAQIVEKCIKAFEDLTAGDKEGHEGFDSDDEMYKYYSDYYKIPVNESTEVTVIKFQLI